MFMVATDLDEIESVRRVDAGAVSYDPLLKFGVFSLGAIRKSVP
ncbi:hypothetical protein [Brevibacterium aurantiacum]|nr:hypothetical protein [Brevibacterium aurantiacum]